MFNKKKLTLDYIVQSFDQTIEQLAALRANNADVIQSNNETIDRLKVDVFELTEENDEAAKIEKNLKALLGR